MSTTAEPAEPHARVTVINHVGWLEFDRPPVNAFEWSMVRQVTGALDVLAEDQEVRVVEALVRLIGRPRALDFLYGGKLVDAERALAIGLVDEVVAPEALRNTVQAYAEVLSTKPPEALAAIRRTINEGGGLAFDEGLQVERAEAIRLAGTNNFDEGVHAFLDKRDPTWEH